jgi:hypothetical protein
MRITAIIAATLALWVATAFAADATAGAQEPH